MVFMAMGDDNGLNLFFIFNQIGEVRNNNINAQQIFFRECQSGIEYDDFIAIFKNGHVLTDFPKTSQRNNSQLRA